MADISNQTTTVIDHSLIVSHGVGPAIMALPSMKRFQVELISSFVVTTGQGIALLSPGYDDATYAPVSMRDTFIAGCDRVCEGTVTSGI